MIILENVDRNYPNNILKIDENTLLFCGKFNCFNNEMISISEVRSSKMINEFFKRFPKQKCVYLDDIKIIHHISGGNNNLYFYLINKENIDLLEDQFYDDLSIKISRKNLKILLEIFGD